jgi:hypothetical protein
VRRRGFIEEEPAGGRLPPGHSGITVTPTRARLGRCALTCGGVSADCAMSGSRRAPLPSLLDLAWRTAFRVGFPLARIWWRLAHARHEGVAVAVYVGPALLLVRCSYRTGWHLPGGGVRRGETPDAAARNPFNSLPSRALINGPARRTTLGPGMWLPRSLHQLGEACAERDEKFESGFLQR